MACMVKQGAPAARARRRREARRSRAAERERVGVGPREHRKKMGGWAALVALLIFHSIVFAQADPKTALLERAGWDALAAGRAHDAANAFREAIASDPRNAELYVGAGAAAMLERRDADARQALEYALSLDPKLSRARALFGQVLYRAGDLPGAIRQYEMLAPDDKQAAATL